MKRAGFVLGVLLVAGAVVAVAMKGGMVREAFESARDAPAWLWVLALAGPAANNLLISASFWSLTRKYGPVGFWEMAALVFGAWLMNHLPMRAGMIGRVTYHKLVNRIQFIDSVRVMIVGSVMTLVAALHFALVAACWGLEVGAAWVALAGGAPIIAVLAVAAAVAGRKASGGQPLGALLVSLVTRYADLGVWSVRYWVVFRLIGAELEPEYAVALASLTQLSFLVPIVGNGLGVREWTTSAAAGLFGAGSGVSAMWASGLAAEIVNRATELVVALPTGLISIALIARRTRQSGAGSVDGEGAEPGPARSDDSE